MTYLEGTHSLYMNRDNLEEYIEIVVAIAKAIAKKAEKVLNYCKDFYNNITQKVTHICDIYNYIQKIITIDMRYNKKYQQQFTV